MTRTLPYLILVITILALATLACGTPPDELTNWQNDTMGNQRTGLPTDVPTATVEVER